MSINAQLARVNSIDHNFKPGSIDGSHLSWQSFRQHVLAPHKIRIMPSLSTERTIPNTIIDSVQLSDAMSTDTRNKSRTSARRFDLAVALDPLTSFHPIYCH